MPTYRLFAAGDRTGTETGLWFATAGLTAWSGTLRATRMAGAGSSLAVTLQEAPRQNDDDAVAVASATFAAVTPSSSFPVNETDATVTLRADTRYLRAKGTMTGSPTACVYEVEATAIPFTLGDHGTRLPLPLRATSTFPDAQNCLDAAIRDVERFYQSDSLGTLALAMSAANFLGIFRDAIAAQFRWRWRDYQEPSSDPKVAELSEGRTLRSGGLAPEAVALLSPYDLRTVWRGR